MRYSIGDVSRLLGMTASALHFYEKEGIIDTPRGETGRRYYEEADVNRLISAKKYRAMGVSLKDIAQQFSQDGFNPQQIIDVMQVKRQEAVEVIRRQEALIEDIDRLTALGHASLKATGVVDIRPVEDMLCFVSSCGGRVPRGKEEQALARRWLEAVPAVSLAICRLPDAPKARCALIIQARRAKAFGLEQNERTVRVIPGGTALHAIVACGEEQYHDPDLIFKPILEFAQKHNFIPAGPLWGSMIFVDCAGGVRKHYFDTYMVFR